MGALLSSPRTHPLLLLYRTIVCLSVLSPAHLKHIPSLDLRLLLPLHVFLDSYEVPFYKAYSKGDEEQNLSTVTIPTAYIFAALYTRRQYCSR